MKISILVPVYKVEHYIERCARSMFEQSYLDLEFVFVNDCTPDRSVDILKQVIEAYPDRKSAIKIITHEENKGVAATRNTLLDNAEGDFVSWVDSDDWLESNAIELLAKKQMETGVDIVSGNIYMHYEDHIRELVEKKHQNKEQFLLQQLKDTWSMDSFLWGRIYKRSLYENNHIRCMEGCNYAEDRYQVVRLSYFAKSFATIDAFVYNYEKRNESSITKLQNDNFEAYLKNQYQHLQNWIGIRDFFSDKEPQYYQLAVSNTSCLLKMNLDWALKYKNKADFYDIVGLIYANEDCMKKLHWRKNRLRAILLRYMWLKQIAKRTMRNIWKKRGSC